MPALTHGRVVNGFNAYPKIYKSIPNTNKNNCNKKIYEPNGTIIPQKYINSNSCSSQKCRRILTKDYPKSTRMRYKISQRGIGDSLRRNILNRKTRNKANLEHKLNLKYNTNNYNLNKQTSKCNCYCFKLF